VDVTVFFQFMSWYIFAFVSLVSFISVLQFSEPRSFILVRFFRGILLSVFIVKTSQSVASNFYFLPSILREEPGIRQFPPDHIVLHQGGGEARVRKNSMKFPAFLCFSRCISVWLLQLNWFLEFSQLLLFIFRIISRYAIVAC